MKMLSTVRAFGLGLALFGNAAFAVAQAAPDQMTMPDHDGPGGGHRGGGPRGFDAMDANHDGFVTLEEWKAAGRPEERFAQIDVNHTGRITREDLQAFREKMRAAHDHDGGDHQPH